MADRFGHRAARPPWVRPVPVSDGGTGQEVASGRARLWGWSLQNTNAAANTLAIKDNTGNSGLTLITIPIAASSYSISMPAEPGVLAEIGLFALAAAASITGVIYISDESLVGFGRDDDLTEAELEVVALGQGSTAIPGGHPGRYGA